MLLVGYFVWDQYQQGRVALPGIQPVASPAASPTVTTTTVPASSLELEPVDFVTKPERKKILELVAAKDYAEGLTMSDAWLRRNPTDALIGLMRENAIVELGNSEAYTIGVSAPLTGALKQVGEAFLQGVLLAVRQVNSSGGFLRGTVRNGTKVINRIRVRVLNDAGDRAAAIKVASSFAKDKSIWGVVGPYSSSTLLAAAPIYNNSNNVIIAPAATNPRISSAGANIYRVAPSHEWAAVFCSKVKQSRCVPVDARTPRDWQHRVPHALIRIAQQLKRHRLGNEWRFRHRHRKTHRDLLVMSQALEYRERRIAVPGHRFEQTQFR